MKLVITFATVATEPSCEMNKLGGFTCGYALTKQRASHNAHT